MLRIKMGYTVKGLLAGFAGLMISVVGFQANAAQIACGDDSVCMYLGNSSGNDVAPGSGPREAYLKAALANVGIYDTPIYLAKLDIDDDGNVSRRSGPEKYRFGVWVSNNEKYGKWGTNLGKVVKYVTVKAGNQYAIYKYDPMASWGWWSTRDLKVGHYNQPTISHITFWGMKMTDIPVPGLFILFFLTLIGLGWATRRRSEMASV